MRTYGGSGAHPLGYCSLSFYKDNPLVHVEFQLAKIGVGLMWRKVSRTVDYLPLNCTESEYRGPKYDC